MTRREAREQAFIILFEKIFNSETPIFEIVESAKEACLIKINGFAENILKTVESNAEEIDASIQSNTPDWTISRLPKVSLAILRLAVSEIKYIDEDCYDKTVEINFDAPVTIKLITGNDDISRVSICTLEIVEKK